MRESFLSPGDLFLTQGSNLCLLHQQVDSLPLSMHAQSLQSCPTLCDPTDSSPPGFSVHGILQAIILEWIAIAFSRGIFPTRGSNPRLLHLLHWQAGSLLLAPPGSQQGRFHAFFLSLCYFL